MNTSAHPHFLFIPALLILAPPPIRSSVVPRIEYPAHRICSFFNPQSQIDNLQPTIYSFLPSFRGNENPARRIHFFFNLQFSIKNQQSKSTDSFREKIYKSDFYSSHI